MPTSLPNDPRGSLFRKWDLHVHSPESLIHHFGGQDPWADWLADIERLPPEFAVLGINDYLFLDGYERAISERSNGRLKNIAALFPVIELRLALFAGSASHFSRINLHVIFNNNLTPDLIKAQFLNRLSGNYQLDHHNTGITWSGALTKQSLLDLGNLIKEKTPPDKRAQVKGGLHTGFANLNLNAEHVFEVLKSSYLKDNYFLALGKAEWDQLRWDQATADKRHLANTAHLLFTASNTLAEYERAKAALKTQAVNHTLLDCSDAHHYSTATDKDRIGNCMTWINADPTFEGLKIAISEYDNRIFVGTTPPVIERVTANPAATISQITITKKPTSTLTEEWFNATVPINPGLAAIIGSKGSGKSALADIIGLLGNTTRHNDFSFLNDKKFRQPPTKKAGHFTATITWANNTTTTRDLDANHDTAQSETISYLPQRFLETVCNEIGTGTKTQFDNELETVIFSHVEPQDQLGKHSLRELLDYKTQLISAKTKRLRTELSTINQHIITIEEQLHHTHRAKLQNALARAQEQLQAIEQQQPTPVAKPTDDPNQQLAQQTLSTAIQELRNEQQTLADTITLQQQRRSKNTKHLAVITRAQQTVRDFAETWASFKNTWEHDDEFTAHSITLENVITVTVNQEPLDVLTAQANKTKELLDDDLDKQHAGGSAYRLAAIEEELTALQAQLNLPNQHYLAYLQLREEWEQRKQALTGTINDPETIKGITYQLELLDNLPAQYSVHLNGREAKVREIHDAIQTLITEYKTLYQPVQHFIANHPIAKAKLRLEFDVRITTQGLLTGFFDFIHQGVNGSFYGVEDGRRVLQQLIHASDLQTADTTITFLQHITAHLTIDHRQHPPHPVTIESQLKRDKNRQGLYDYLFGIEYLVPKYLLQWTNRDLSQLSAGEKGTLLLVFYLLLDKRDTPLVIDQPEDNLDNETVYDLLAPTIVEARSHRQVIIVTHNPNLAVAADADQIIHAHHDKTTQRITYTSGGLEHPTITPKVIDILEGTRPAFKNRDHKYTVNAPR